MSKLVLNDIASGFQSNTAANTNNTLIETALENTLSRDGTSPNQMEANLDMNSHRVVNLAEPINTNEAARLQDVLNAVSGVTSANLLSFTPYSNIASNTVQGAIQEEVDDLAASSGSSLVGFIQTGTGATARTTQTKLRDIVSFKDFGAVGDGVADDTTALQNTFTYASANSKRIVDYSGSTYKYTSNISCGSIELEGNVTFTGTNAFIDLTGSVTEVGYISAAATQGKNTTTLSSVTGISQGDVLILQNTVASSFSAHRTNYYDGEMVRVLSVDAGTKIVTYESSLLTSYSGVVTDKVFKINSINVNIKGCLFTGTGVFTLRVKCAVNSELDFVTINCLGTSSALFLDKSYEIKIIGGKYTHPTAGLSDEYGINISNCQNVTVDGVDAFSGWHAVTTGGDNQNGAVPCRNIRVIRSTLSNSPASGLHAADFHGNTADSYYEDCIITGHVGLGGKNVGVIGGKVTTHPSSAYSPLSYHELVSGDLLFKDCKVEIGNASTATAVVSNLSSASVALISNVYTVTVDGLDAVLNNNVTGIVNAYDNSGKANAWIVKRFGVRGSIAGLTNIIAFTKAGAGVDASFIYINEPLFDTSPYTLVAKSGTTLPNCRFVFPEYIGSSANGIYVKMANGTMICRHSFSIAATAINTAFLGGFRSGGLTWTFPAAFLTGTTPVVSIVPTGATAFSAVQSTTSVTDTLFFLTAITAQGAATITADVVATGRWY